MGRPVSIDPLRFRNFKLGTDSIIGKYDEAKAQKDGEKLSEKNLYANPQNYQMCLWTGLGVWCALMEDHLLNHKHLRSEERRVGKEC